MISFYVSIYFSVGAVLAAFSLNNHLKDETKKEVWRRTHQTLLNIPEYLDVMKEYPGLMEKTKKAGYFLGGLSYAIALFFFWPLLAALWFIKELRGS